MVKQPKNQDGRGKTYRRWFLTAFSLRRISRQHRLNGLYHLRVHLLPRGNHTKICTERATETEVEWAPTRIGDDSASFFDEERPRGMVLRKHITQIKTEKISVRGTFFAN